MNLKEIGKRSLREIKNSTSDQMLACAWRYYRLFFAAMLRAKVDGQVIKDTDTIVIRAYMKRKQELNKI